MRSSSWSCCVLGVVLLLLRLPETHQFFSPSVPLILSSKSDTSSHTSIRLTQPAPEAYGLRVGPSCPGRASPSGLQMNSQPLHASGLQKLDLLPRERYVAFNRHFTRKSNPLAAAKLEMRWAQRNSTLATCDGFRFFSLLRRIQTEMEYDENKPDYMTLMVWDDKKKYQTWRTGNAFKEAHAGGQLTDILVDLIDVLKILHSPPVPAFWDGIHLDSIPGSTSPVQLLQRDDNGRAKADGKSLLPTECFVTFDDLQVLPENRASFEKEWEAQRNGILSQEGFVGSTLLRRASSTPKPPIWHGVNPCRAADSSVNPRRSTATSNPLSLSAAQPQP